jgi:hypothetical protein
MHCDKGPPAPCHSLEFQTRHRQPQAFDCVAPRKRPIVVLTDVYTLLPWEPSMSMRIAFGRPPIELSFDGRHASAVLVQVMQHPFLGLYAEMTELEQCLWDAQVAIWQHLQQVQRFDKLPDNANTIFTGPTNPALPSTSKERVQHMRRCCHAAKERPPQCALLAEAWRGVMNRIVKKEQPEKAPPPRGFSVQERIDAAVTSAGMAGGLSCSLFTPSGIWRGWCLQLHLAQAILFRYGQYEDA